MRRKSRKARKEAVPARRPGAALVHRRSRKLGLPPGTLVHIGQQKAEQAEITIIDYDETHLSEAKTRQVEACFPYRDLPTVTWVNVDGVHDVELVEKVGTCFGVHPLVLEDLVNTGQRIKAEDFRDYLFLVLKVVSPEGDGFEIDQLSLIVGANFVLTFQEREGPIVAAMRERLANEKARIRRSGPDYLAYSILDLVVDSYFVVLEKIGDRIEALEDEVVSRPTHQTFREIHELKREMILVRKAVWPLRELLGELSRGDSPLVRESTVLYLRDVHDHMIQIIETADTFRELLSGYVDVYLSSVSNRLNAVMKVLAVIATIFMPMTFIAGVYGMNFKTMPELEWSWGYPMALGLMGLVALSMLAFFRRRGWLGGGAES